MGNVKPLNTKAQKQLAARLEHSGAQIAALQADLAREVAARDQLIARATEAGLSRRQIADRTGLTRGRVQQIIDGAR